MQEQARFRGVRSASCVSGRARLPPSRSGKKYEFRSDAYLQVNTSGTKPLATHEYMVPGFGRRRRTTKTLWLPRAKTSGSPEARADVDATHHSEPGGGRAAATGSCRSTARKTPKQRAGSVSSGCCNFAKTVKHPMAVLCQTASRRLRLAGNDKTETPITPQPTLSPFPIHREEYR